MLCSVLRHVGKERKDFQLPLRELWLPLAYCLFLIYILNFILKITSAAFRKTAQMPNACHYISIQPYDCLFTNIFCRERRKETNRFLHHGHFFQRFLPSKVYPPHLFSFMCCGTLCFYSGNGISSTETSFPREIFHSSGENDTWIICVHL